LTQQRKKRENIERRKEKKKEGRRKEGWSRREEDADEKIISAGVSDLDRVEGGGERVFSDCGDCDD
jgi:hypothetical protein